MSIWTVQYGKNLIQVYSIGITRDGMPAKWSSRTAHESSPIKSPEDLMQIRFGNRLPVSYFSGLHKTLVETLR